MLSVALAALISASPGSTLADALINQGESVQLESAYDDFVGLDRVEQRAFLNTWKTKASPSDLNLRLYLMFTDAQRGRRLNLPELSEHKLQRRATTPTPTTQRLFYPYLYAHRTPQTVAAWACDLVLSARYLHSLKTAR